MAEQTTIRLYGTVEDSIVDGPGLRFSVFVQGCSHHCPGCHNPQSQPMEGGTVEAVEHLAERILSNKLDRAVTLSGGEPFEQPVACAELVRILKRKGINVWSYTGYLYEDLLALARSAQDESLDQAERERRAAVGALLELIDVLIDGPFILEKRSLSLLYRGSPNQRIIDMAATRAQGSVVLWERRDEFPTKPASW